MTKANPATPAEAAFWDSLDELDANEVSTEDRERIFMEEVMGEPGPEDEPANLAEVRRWLRKDLKAMEARGVTPTLPT